MDPLSVIIGVVIFVIGVGVGVGVGRLRRPKPVCGCKHHLSMHDPETGLCHAEVEMKIDPPAGERDYVEWRPCACRRYVGPKPLADDVWVAPQAIDR